MGQQNIDFYPSHLLFPCLVLCIIVMAFNLLGDGLRDALDPRPVSYTHLDVYKRQPQLRARYVEAGALG